MPPRERYLYLSLSRAPTNKRYALAQSEIVELKGHIPDILGIPTKCLVHRKLCCLCWATWKALSDEAPRRFGPVISIEGTPTHQTLVILPWYLFLMKQTDHAAERRRQISTHRHVHQFSFDI